MVAGGIRKYTAKKETDKNVKIEHLFIGNNSAQIHFTVEARSGMNELPSCPL